MSSSSSSASSATIPARIRSVRLARTRTRAKPTAKTVALPEPSSSSSSTITAGSLSVQQPHTVLALNPTPTPMFPANTPLATLEHLLHFTAHVLPRPKNAQIPWPNTHACPLNCVLKSLADLWLWDDDRANFTAAMQLLHSDFERICGFVAEDGEVGAEVVEAFEEVVRVLEKLERVYEGNQEVVKVWMKCNKRSEISPEVLDAEAAFKQEIYTYAWIRFAARLNLRYDALMAAVAPFQTDEDIWAITVALMEMHILFTNSNPWAYTSRPFDESEWGFLCICLAELEKRIGACVERWHEGRLVREMRQALRPFQQFLVGVVKAGGCAEL